MKLTKMFLIIFLIGSLHAEDGFVPLFNGRDLTGWVPLNVAADTFFVRDGMIVTTGEPVGLMRTARMYENFILELEWRHMKEAGNSGVFTWADGLPSVGGPFPRGIEVQVLDPGYAKRPGANEWFTTHGDIFPVRGATMTTFGRISKTGQRSFPIEDRTKPSPEWNHYRLVANRGELRLSVNGKEVTIGKDCVPRKGFLCLEAEGSECQFRNLRIKELPSSNTPPEQTANPYEGFRPLFNGKDLGGWKTSDAINAVWSARGSHFTSKGGVKGRKLDLWTEKSYRDFVLCVDWRLTKKPERKPLPTFTADGLYARDDKGEIIRKEILHAGDSGIFLRGDGRYQVNIWSQPMGSGDINELHKDEKLPADLRRAMLPKVKADAPFGKWNRFYITLKGDRVTVVLNDQTVIENCPLPGIAPEGPIALQYHGDDLEFTNIFIRELPQGQQASNKLIGTWKLISIEERDADGKLTVPLDYGLNPVGLLTYDATGHMSAQAMRRGRAKLPSDDVHVATPEQAKAAFTGYNGYFGTYEIIESESIVIHHVEGSMIPNWEGGDQRRKFTISGDKLILEPPPIQAGGAKRVRRLTWERVR